MDQTSPQQFKYPRRRLLRGVMRHLVKVAYAALSDFTIIGAENLPAKGPLLVVANHFSFMDPVAVIRSVPYPIEFVGGFQMPNAPASVTWLPKMWGYFPVYRGSVSRRALIAAQSVLNQDGVLGIFPEAGNWATVLRPARPGAAFLAARTNAPLLPIGIHGLLDVFPSIKKGKRAPVTVRIGKPFGPYNFSVKNRTDRKQLDEIGHEIMRKIAELIPPEWRGHYSNDPAIREAAQGTEIYPWDKAPEG